MDPLICFFGLAVGVLVGLTGIGGGSLMTPLLILVVGTHPVIAVGTDIAYGAVTKTVGGWRHLRKGTVDLGVSKWLAFGSVPGALLGVVIVKQLSGGAAFEDGLLIAVAAALLIVACATLGRALFMPALLGRERETVTLTRGTRRTAVGLGLILGCILGLTSVGSGALIGLALIFVFRLTPHRVVGTDVFHAAVLLWAAGLAHLVAGNVDLLLMANVLLGSIPGVWLGTSLSARVPAAGLRPALGCVLLASAMGVAAKAGVAIPPAAIVAVPAALGLLAWVMTRRRARAGAAGALDPAPAAAPAP